MCWWGELQTGFSGVAHPQNFEDEEGCEGDATGESQESRLRCREREKGYGEKL